MVYFRLDNFVSATGNGIFVRPRDTEILTDLIITIAMCAYRRFDFKIIIIICMYIEIEFPLTYHFRFSFLCLSLYHYI
jgi:hypothetical protein